MDSIETQLHFGDQELSAKVGLKALLVGERIDIRPFEDWEALAQNPLVVESHGHGYTVIFRYGVVVFVGVKPEDQAVFLARLGGFIHGEYKAVETETLMLEIDPSYRQGLFNGVLRLNHFSLERLQMIAHVLAKSVILDHYEAEIAESFERIEPLARQLKETGKGGRSARTFLRHIGAGLLGEHKMIGRVEILEKPEILWEHPSLEGLYLRIEDEFELRERHLVLERKLELNSRTVQTLLELLTNQRSLRVEWYIVILIVVDIVVSLY
ncbi:MAG: RMD1 family protein [Myxococcota bacterium]|nr:RMD1 family protein [Myxococcota bacterium]